MFFNLDNAAEMLKQAGIDLNDKIPNIDAVSSGFRTSINVYNDGEESILVIYHPDALDEFFRIDEMKTSFTYKGRPYITSLSVKQLEDVRNEYFEQLKPKKK